MWPSSPTAQKVWETKGSGPEDPQELNRYAYALNNPLKYTDTSGHFAWVFAGAAIGGGIDLAVQLTTNGGDFSKVNWVEVGVSAAVGATGVGVGAAIAKVTTHAAVAIAANGLASAAVSAAGAEVQNQLQEVVTPGKLAPVDPGRAAVIGGALGAAGAALPIGAEKALTAVQNMRAAASQRSLTVQQLGLLNSVVSYGRRGPTPGDYLVGAANASGIAASNAGPVVDPALPR